MASIRKLTRKSGTSYRADIRLKGRQPVRATFHRLSDAKKWVQETETEIRAGRYFRSREAEKHSLSDMVNRYIELEVPKHRYPRAKATPLRQWAAEIGHLTLADVTPAVISEQRDRMLTTLSPGTVTRYMTVLSGCFALAIDEWGWLEENPMRKVRSPSLPRGRVRFLSEDETIDGVLVEGERTRLLRACKESPNPYLYVVVVLALSTGMRKGEIIGLTWRQVDLKLARITLYETKNGEVRVVPIAGHALELLKQHARVRAIDTQLLFPSKNNRASPQQFPRTWTTARKRAGITDFRFHDLRHSAASYLAMNGASLAEIAETLGHKTLTMAKRYTHLSEAHKTEVISKLDQRIFGGDS